ncbi:MAG: hypothetical protein IGS48_02460 [Oscillatoriales cyanobacterium C42_A2020_001]|nr:hypothetical protein [Leptolyngbyaceae cyanobacterium C42_A2020_001]
MPNQDEVNSAIGSAETAWLGRLITRVEGSVDKLADRIQGLEKAIDQDMKDMREGFRREVAEVDNRVARLETRLAQLDVTNKIIASLGAAALVGLVAIAITRVFNPPSHSPVPTTEQRK